MKYKHVVFDVDGTLLDTEQAVLLSLQDTIQTLTGHSPSLEELVFSLGIPGTDALLRLNVPDVPGALALWEGKLQAYQHTIRPFDGIPQLVEALAGLGLGLGVVTSRTRFEFDVDFNALPFTPHLKTVICADDTDTHKPQAGPLLAYMERAGCAPGDLLYVGDSPYDQQCAANAGTHFALAGWGAKSDLPAQYTLRRPGDLLAVLS